MEDMIGPASVRVTWGPEDHWALTRFSILETPVFKRVRRLAHLATAVVFAGSLGPVVAHVLLAPFGLSVWRAGNAQVLVMLLMGVAGWWVAPVFYMRYARWRLTGSLKHLPGLLGEQQFVVSAEGIQRKNEAGEETCRWSVITDVAEDDGHVYLVAGPQAAYIFPKRDLSEGQQTAIKALGSTHSGGRPSVFIAPSISPLETAAYVAGAIILGGAGISALLLLLFT